MAAAFLSLQEAKELRPHDGRDPTVYGGAVTLPRQGISAPLETMLSSTGSERSATEAKALRIHSKAEHRRHERINTHLAALRRMIPNIKQMDKATLLARVVDQVKHLKSTSSEATQHAPPILAEADEVSVAYCGGDDGNLFIKASVSCDDRLTLSPGLSRRSTA